MAKRVAAAAALLTFSAAALDPRCFDVGNSSAPFQCTPDGTLAGIDTCFLACAACSTADLAWALTSVGQGAFCDAGSVAVRTPDGIAAGVAAAVMKLGATQGYFWLDGPGEPENNATAAMVHLLRYMPRRDALLLANQPYLMVDFLCEHIRYALATLPWSSALGLSDWGIFADYVLPYGILTEKRDLWFRWRPRFSQALAPLVAGAPNITAAAQAIVAAMPLLQAQGVLAFTSQPTPGMMGAAVAGSGRGLRAAGGGNGAVSTSAAVSASSEAFVAGNPVTWHSGTAPGFQSPQQVVQLGGSCTGTGIILVAAARSVGIPARLEGCSESVVRGDDHHWAGFYEPLRPTSGPFGDGWHTREGSSAGNPDGPWDAPSGPMLGCLQGVVPGSSLDTLWATAWSAPAFLPTLWANDTWAQTWSRVAGVNRCGAYCTAWGCGVNNTMHYDQTQCGPAS